MDTLETGHAPPSDRALARRAAMGDRGAFGELFQRHSASTFSYALHMLDGDEQEAQDATQDAWVKAWRHLPDFRGEAQLRTWLFKIVAREVLSGRRRPRPFAVDDSLIAARAAPSVETPEQKVREFELREALELALTELPWRQRASWLLREFEGLSYAEIAEVLDTTPTVVRGQLHRAKQTLAIRMEQWR